MRTCTRIGLIFAATAVLLAGRTVVVAAGRYRFGVNETTSLPNWAFVVDLKNRSPRRGELVRFTAPDNPYYPRGAQFVKHVWGVPGDRVERRGREYFVDGRDVGYAKLFSQTGRSASLGPTGVIPPGRYYVGTASKDGFDSRYADIGWISADRIVGVARPVL